MVELNYSSPSLVHERCHFIAKFVFSCNSIPPLACAYTQSRPAVNKKAVRYFKFCVRKLVYVLWEN